MVLIGTDFEVRVWETLLRIPMGRAATYSDIAAKVCTTKAARAVGAAVGKNPVCFVVPCHRVIGKERQPHRLSLGPDAQARHARLGSGKIESKASVRRHDRIVRQAARSRNHGGIALIADARATP